MLPELKRLIEQMGKDRGIDKSVIIEALETAMLTAARKKLGLHVELEAQGLPGTVLVLIDVIAADGEVVLVLAEPEQPTRFKITATIMKITPVIVINFFITHLLQT